MPRPAKPRAITPHQRTQIAAQAFVSERTVNKVYDGLASDNPTLQVARAAAVLGLPAPPPLKDRNAA